MISAAQLRFIQKIGEKWMTTDVTIRHKKDPALDPSDPYGDDIVDFKPIETTVKGWLVPILSKTVDAYQSQVIAIGDFKLRLPVGTSIGPEDHVVIGGLTYGVIDTADEQTWPEWLSCTIRRNTP